MEKKYGYAYQGIIYAYYFLHPLIFML